MTIYNCACDDEFPKETLANLRKRLIRRLGFSAQAASPPPGMAELMDDFLMEAQRLAYSGYTPFQGKRWYTWDIVAGERFYDFADGDDEDASCVKRLQPGKIAWVGVSQNDGPWTELHRGISGEMYAGSSMSQGFPTRYELGSCIELWPTPVGTGYKLRVRGAFGLLPFSADAHTTTIDPDVVFMRALALAKQHYGKPDWQSYVELADIRVHEMVADTHQGNRYIPRDMPQCSWEHLNGVSGPFGIRFEEGGDVRFVE